MVNLKCWKKAYNPSDKNNSPIYSNIKKKLWIQRAGKQLGKFDNFETEKYPVIVQSTGGSEVHRKWFEDKRSANKYMRKYMKETKC